MRLKDLGKGIVDGDVLMAAAYSDFQSRPAHAVRVAWEKLYPLPLWP